MPTRSRNARNKKSHNAVNATSPSLPSALLPGYTTASSTDGTPLDSPALSPPTHLPTPLPEPQERIHAALAVREGELAMPHHLDAVGAEVEDAVPVGPEVGDSGEEGRDMEEDVLRHLIDFSSSPPAASSTHFPEPMPATHRAASRGHGTLLGEDTGFDHEASLSGFLNDHLEAPSDQHDATPFQATPFQHDDLHRPFDHDLQATSYSERLQAEGVYDPEPTSYKSPPFMEARLPEVEDDVDLHPSASHRLHGQQVQDDEEEVALPVPPPHSDLTRTRDRISENHQAHGRKGPSSETTRPGIETVGNERGERQGQGGHVRSPVVPSRSTSSTSASRSSHSRSSSNPPSLVPDLSSPSKSTFGSLSKTIRSYAPSLPLSIPSQTSNKSAPYPPLVSRPVISGRVDSGHGSGNARNPNPYQQEYEREYERHYSYDDDIQDPYGYGYSKSPTTPVSAPLAPSRVTTRSASRGTTSVSSRSTSRVASTVPDRQQAWPEHTSSLPPQQPTVSTSRHRNTRSQGSQVGLGSGLTQTLRGGLETGVTARGRDPHSAVSSYPRSGTDEDGVDRVVWARWDMMAGRQVLVVGYERGVQVWDVSRLGSVEEVLNLDLSVGMDGWTDSKEGRVVGVVKTCVSGEGQLVMLLETEDRAETKAMVVLYSVIEDRVVGRWAVRGVPMDMECSREAFVVSTSSPPALHILYPSLTLHHTLSASSLALYSTPRVSSSQLALAIPSSISPPSGSPYGQGHMADKRHGDVIDTTSPMSAAHRAELPHSVFALHGRLLAYAVPSTSASSSLGLRRKDSSLSSSSGGSGPSPSSATSSSPLTSGLGLGSGIGGIPNTKAELGTAALKVGSGLLGGMKFLGGMALEGVKNRMSAPSTTPSVSSSPGGSVTGGTGNGGAGNGGMFSRSAPTREPVVLSAEEERKRRRFSDHQGVLAPLAAKRTSNTQGFTVVVVDLSSLSKASVGLDKKERDAEKPLRVVAEFVGSRSQPIARLEFTPDGCGVYVVPRDGYVTKVFQLRPSYPSSSSSPTSSDKTTPSNGTVLPLYELRRGRVSTAVVEDIQAISDSRWTGIVTRNRTVHVFATNPGGGKTHLASHLEGRMQNNPLGPTTIVELKPLVRFGGAKLSLEDGYSPEVPPPAMAFTFVDPLSTFLPLSLAPTPVPRSAPLASPPLAAGLSASPGSPLSPKHVRVPKNYQDVLLFDSATGTLYLQRITVEQRAKSELVSLGGAVGLVNAAINTSTSLGSKSISASLPKSGDAGPLGMTGVSIPSSSVSSQSGMAGHGQRQAGLGEEAYELVGRANIVATWDLRKRRDWEEIRGKGLAGSGNGAGVKERDGISGCDEWLAQAELSTFSKCLSARSRSVYLTHQFSFHTLGEDYHALIRKYRLDVHGSKIDVRKDIPIHAFTQAQGTNSESFIEGFSPTRSNAGHSGVSSSFDEPLASALAGEMEYHPSANVLPMYPNGPGGGTGRSAALRNSIPIRKIGDGVSEGLGRFRKAVPAVRSPRLGPSRPGGGPEDVASDVLLEFDEEVDDFMAPRIVKSAAGAGVERGLDDDVVGTVDEEIWGDKGWDSQDRMAVEEEETFHAISGTLSPQFEREVMLPPTTASPSVGAGGGKAASTSKKSRKGRK